VDLLEILVLQDLQGLVDREGQEYLAHQGFREEPDQQGILVQVEL